MAEQVTQVEVLTDRPLVAIGRQVITSATDILKDPSTPLQDQAVVAEALGQILTGLTVLDSYVQPSEIVPPEEPDLLVATNVDTDNPVSPSVAEANSSDLTPVSREPEQPRTVATLPENLETGNSTGTFITGAEPKDKRVTATELDRAFILEQLRANPGRPLGPGDFLSAGFGKRMTNHHSRKTACSVAITSLINDPEAEALGIKIVDGGNTRRKISFSPDGENTADASVSPPESLPSQAHPVIKPVAKALVTKEANPTERIALTNWGLGVTFRGGSPIFFVGNRELRDLLQIGRPLLTIFAAFSARKAINSVLLPEFAPSVAALSKDIPMPEGHEEEIITGLLHRFTQELDRVGARAALERDFNLRTIHPSKQSVKMLTIQGMPPKTDEESRVFLGNLGYSDRAINDFLEQPRP